MVEEIADGLPHHVGVQCDRVTVVLDLFEEPFLSVLISLDHLAKMTFVEGDKVDVFATFEFKPLPVTQLNPALKSNFNLVNESANGGISVLIA